MVRSSSLISTALSLLSSAQAVSNGLAITPPMGWNNWNSLACDVSEDLLLSTSKILIETGLQDLGYDHVVLDDCWQAPRGDDGYVTANKEKFPNGMKHVSDELHSVGFKFGMYSSAGEMTCARFAGSLDYETQDAENFAAWGVDFLKYDNCYHMGRMGTPKLSFDRFKVMADALKATGRNIALSLCSWGEDYVHTQVSLFRLVRNGMLWVWLGTFGVWGMSIANAWRMSGDIYDSFTRPDVLCGCDTKNPADPFCIAPGTHCSVLFILNKVAPFADRSIPGGWSDLDMLEVGQGGMTDEEYKAHFALWAALKSPLMLGNDLRTMTSSTLSIVNNPAIIALSQDPHGRSATRVAQNTSVPKDEYGVGETHIWSGQLENGDQVVILLNAAGENLEMSASLVEIFTASGPHGSAPQVKLAWEVWDLWADRMSEKDAQSILDAETATKRKQILANMKWYNSTEISYKEGLEKGDERLFGKKVGVIQPKGKWDVVVEKHSAKVYRFRSVKGKTGSHEEL
ncbi:related to alpha-galactosidase precursor [Rhynchosporium agropyri]|uniref:Alpha-galactosidase n=1 Tax=Rhynchosporium agropyri TaxID=914238 RepID=A0A1E1KBC5_9HELO|nr:related to alpha-galactosidase precursor [Rhynchosporium agropyri]